MLPVVLIFIIALGLSVYAAHELAPGLWPALTAALQPRPAGAPSRALPASERRALPPWDARPLAVWAPLAVVLLAFVVRVLDLTGSPFGFFCDEASNGLDAYLIGHTLHDQHGALLPVYFQALSDYRGGFHIYWDVPFMLVFGLTEFAVRFGSVVAGTLTVGLTYLFVGKAVNRPAGLLAAFVLATAPWHIIHSRVGWEEISVPFVTALCLTFLYYGLERPRLLPLAFVFGALGMYTYQPGRVFFPLFCLAWLIIYAGPLWRRRRSSLVGIVAGVIILIPTGLSILDGTFFARLNQLNGPPQGFGDRLATFWTNYLAHFQSAFLFDTSTDIILRHYVRGFGMLYGVTAPFLILGVLVMIARHRRADLLFLAWFLIYPIAAALVGPPISTRSITGVIVFCIAIGQGLYTAGQGLAWLTTRVTTASAYRRALVGSAGALVLVVGLGATAQFMSVYLGDYPTYSSQWWGWQSGFKQITARFEQEHTRYATLLVDDKANAPDELMRFYEQNNPATCPNCRITDIMNPALVQQDYVKGERELWAVPSDDYPIATAFQALKGRTVGRLTIPGGATSWYFIATGPGA